MAITVKLSRGDNTPWGFRLSGGTDFGVPLTVSKVNYGSLAESAGLRAGDAIVGINGHDALRMRHSEAQNTLKQAGNNFDMIISRGGSVGTTIWKPQVTPIGNAPTSPQPSAMMNNGLPEVTPVTKTSLAARPQESRNVGSQHNFSPKPFNVAGPYGDTVKTITNKQFNSPLAMYSEESIAETLSAQAEVLASGVLGVNFLKYDKQPKAPDTSEVMKVIVEEARASRGSSPVPPRRGVSPLPTRRSVSPAPPRHHVPPATNLHPSPAVERSPSPQPPPSAAGLNVCADCGRTIVSVFVRVKDKSLHPECFKCATCGSNLRNAGYYNISNKLYCDIHARQAAKVNAPATNLEPVTVPPGGKVPSGAVFSPSKPAAPPISPIASSPHKLTSSPTPFKEEDLRTSPSPRCLSPVPPEQFTPPRPITPIPDTPTIIETLSSPRATSPFPEVPQHSKASTPAPEDMDHCETPEPTKEPSPDMDRQISPTIMVDPSDFLISQLTYPDRARTPERPTHLAYTEANTQPSAEANTQPSAEANTQPSAEANLQPAAQPNIQSVATNLPDFQPMSNIAPPKVKAYSSVGKPHGGGSQFVWPPPKQEEDEQSVATATPAYIAPTQVEGSLLTSSSQSQSSSTVMESSSYKQTSSFSSVQQKSQSSMTSGYSSGPTPFSKVSAPVSTPTKPFTLSSPASTTPSFSAPAPTSPSSFPPTPPVSYSSPSFPGSTTPAKGASTTAGIRQGPRRGKGAMNQPNLAGRIPVCAATGKQIRITIPGRGPFVTALGKCWSPEAFVCATPTCRRNLQDIGFIEEGGKLYCEICWEQYIAPICNKCSKRVKGDCLMAIGKNFHPDCFVCAYCKNMFGNAPFYLEDGLPYCENDWNQLFTTKCVGCGFPIEAGDRWVEALNNNYHSQCFKCALCGQNLEGQSFYAKGDRPFCKSHARSR